jgi:hypothetical protein
MGTSLLAQPTPQTIAPQPPRLLDQVALIPGLLPDDLGPFVPWPHQWFWDGHEHVDPAKEAAAQATRLANHTITLAQEYARRGLDWEAQLRQRAKELALVTALGLTPAQAHPTTNPEEEPDDAVATPTRCGSRTGNWCRGARLPQRTGDNDVLPGSQPREGVLIAERICQSLLTGIQLDDLLVRQSATEHLQCIEHDRRCAIARPKI